MKEMKANGVSMKSQLMWLIVSKAEILMAPRKAESGAAGHGVAAYPAIMAAENGVMKLVKISSM